VDHARRHRAAKRGDGETLIYLDDAPAASDPRSVDLLALDETLERLAAVDPRKARALELKYFGGLEMAEIADVLDISVKTVEKDVRLGIIWLRSALGASPAYEPGALSPDRSLTRPPRRSILRHARASSTSNLQVTTSCGGIC
jgi:DNA-directed RNA polymerase specialized sigma24 family protein